MKDLVAFIKSKYLILIILNLMCHNLIFAQGFLKQGGQVSSILLENSSKICLGSSFTPSALLHIKASSTITYPAFKVVLSGFTDSIVSVENCLYRNQTYYGIYQTGPSTGKNYFQNPIQVSNLLINGSLINGATIGVSNNNVDSITFVMKTAVPLSSQCMPLRIDNSGITVRSNIVTNNIQILTKAGVNKVLVSDVNGNGIWTDCSGLMGGKWLISKKEDQTIYLDSTYKSVAIGTDMAQGYPLAVNGKIICEELLVKLHNNWPDNVFSKEYKLPSLKSVNNYVNEEKHLPGVPSAQEVKDKGIGVGEMNAILLKKVEELTLYVISLQKEIDELKASKKDN
ncbi:MAG: hypothetical protein Q8867_01855 [Bacteroidota bacterium]|nr:hypothetical protein [Bacteroidota bacterium]